MRVIVFLRKGAEAALAHGVRRQHVFSLRAQAGDRLLELGVDLIEVPPDCRTRVRGLCEEPRPPRVARWQERERSTVERSAWP